MIQLIFFCMQYFLKFYGFMVFMVNYGLYGTLTK